MLRIRSSGVRGLRKHARRLACPNRPWGLDETTKKGPAADKDLREALTRRRSQLISTTFQGVRVRETNPAGSPFEGVDSEDSSGVRGFRKTAASIAYGY